MSKEDPKDISSMRLDAAFREDFPRVLPVRRDYLEVTDDEDDYPLEGGADLPPDATVFRLSDYPSPGAVRLTPSLRLKDFIPDANQLVLFRLLRRIYGEHDVPFLALLDKKQGLPLAWAYAFRFSSSLICSLESRAAKVELVPYKEKGAEANLSEAERAQLVSFIKRLSSLHANNTRLFDEGTFVKQKSIHVGYVNLFQEKYGGGELLLRMGTDKSVKQKIDHWRLDDLLEGQLKAESNGFLLLSAALFFFISLEALVNLVYAILLKDSLRSDRLFADLTKKDLHVRLNFMHLCCDHFEAAPFPASSSLMEKVREFQSWRNKVVHADLADDLRIYTAIENGVFLHYFPAADNRGPNKSMRADFEISRFQPMVRAADVRKMQQIVDEVRSTIISSLASEAAQMIASAIERPVVSATR